MERLLKKLRALNLLEPIYVIGMGVSGRAALDLLREAGYEALGVDENIKERRVMKRSFDDPEALHGAGTLIMSPGVDRRRPAFTHHHAPQINDVELFALLNEHPVYAVTGANGKSTVVTLLYEALQAAGKHPVLCGNIGYSVLEALFNAPEETDCFVLELSSYQLECCPSLHPRVGALLNITPDHLDRYDTMNQYAAAKAQLLIQSNISIINGEDERVLNLVDLAQNVVIYGLQPSQPNRVDEHIVVQQEALLRCDELHLRGLHNYSNVLCVLLMLRAAGIELSASVLESIKQFKGLSHRMQHVADIDGVRYINDSKATNIGATAAALAGLKEALYLIAGGVGKNQDFSELTAVLKQYPVKRLLLIGKDNQSLEQALQQADIPYENCGDMVRAVRRAKYLAQAGETVLLSPACASLDQYRGYHERGEHFAYEVQNSCP